MYSTFQSHESEFDYLKSLEIEEKINAIRWLDARKNAANFLLTTNDKKIKLWKLSERDRQIDYSDMGMSALMNGSSSNNSSVDESYLQDLGTLKVPKYAPMEMTVLPVLRRDFANGHMFHINSISVNSDQETYLSSDELRINLWNLDVTNESFRKL